MGEGWERNTTSIEDDWHGSQADHVNYCSAEDRSPTTGKVGQGQSAGEEGCLKKSATANKGPLLL
jgi:hypothetical protein